MSLVYKCYINRVQRSEELWGSTQRGVMSSVNQRWSQQWDSKGLFGLLSLCRTSTTAKYADGLQRFSSAEWLEKIIAFLFKFITKRFPRFYITSAYFNSEFSRPLLPNKKMICPKQVLFWIFKDLGKEITIQLLLETTMFLLYIHLLDNWYQSWHIVRHRKTMCNQVAALCLQPQTSKNV